MAKMFKAISLGNDEYDYVEIGDTFDDEDFYDFGEANEEEAERNFENYLRRLERS